MSDLMSPAELAEELGVSVQWLAQRRYMGDGPAFAKLGARKVRYARADVQAWLSAQTRTITQTA